VTSLEYIKDFLTKDDRPLKAQMLGIDYNGLYPDAASLKRKGHKMYRTGNRALATPSFIEWSAMDVVYLDGRIKVVKSSTNDTGNGVRETWPGATTVPNLANLAEAEEKVYIRSVIRRKEDPLNYFSIEEYPPEPFKSLLHKLAWFAAYGIRCDRCNTNCSPADIVGQGETPTTSSGECLCIDCSVKNS